MRETLYDKFLDFNKYRASVRYKLIMYGWTYQELSDFTDYSVSYITNLMRGYGSKKAAIKIAETLGIDPKQFK